MTSELDNWWNVEQRLSALGLAGRAANSSVKVGRPPRRQRLGQFLEAEF